MWIRPLAGRTRRARLGLLRFVGLGLIGWNWLGFDDGREVDRQLFPFILEDLDQRVGRGTGNLCLPDRELRQIVEFHQMCGHAGVGHFRVIEVEASQGMNRRELHQVGIRHRSVAEVRGVANQDAS